MSPRRWQVICRLGLYMYFRIFLNRNETIVVTQNLKLNLLFLYRALFLRVFAFVAKSTMVDS